MTGLMARFDSEEALLAALLRLRSSGWAKTETYTPRPLGGETLDNEARRTSVPLLMFIAGITGFVGFFLLMSYADTHAYPLNIGGRPDFAWPAFVPIAFELGVLCAMVAGFLGFFIVCRLPQLYDPVDACEGFAEASRDGWFVAVRVTAPRDLAEVRDLLRPLQPVTLEEFEP